MGHERLGLLPKTKRWRAIVAEIASADTPPSDVPDIARHTLAALGFRYTELSSDKSVEAAFTFLVEIARAAAGKPTSIDLAGKSQLGLVTDLARRIEARIESLETSEIVRRAAADALSSWSRENIGRQPELFADSTTASAWKDLGTGSGFCELSRLFFARLTARYLNYFLDREASASLPNLQARESFRRQLEKHIGDVSRHAFETARITQSYAAGWFNKHALNDQPSSTQLRRFLSYAFEKIREDLRREGRQ